MAERTSVTGFVRIVPFLCLVSWVVFLSQSPASCGKPEDLQRAVKWGKVAEIKRLLDNGADVNARGPEELTPLYWAAAGGDLSVVRLLLDHGAHVDERCRFGETALAAASSWGHAVVVSLLIDHGARVNLRDDRSVTALTRAAARGHVDVAELLIDHGAEFSGDGKGRGLPLHAAAANGRVAVVKTLLERGAWIDAPDISGRTALMHASYRGMPKVVKLLLDARCEVDQADKHGATALSLACVTGRTQIVRMLLEAGANSETRDRTGKTPRETARERGFGAIIDLLNAKMPCIVHSEDGEVEIGLSARAGRTNGQAGGRPAAAGRADVMVAERPRKVAQLVGEYDREIGGPTLNRTLSRYGIAGTDLGVSFSHEGRTFFLFGDTIGRFGGDCIAHTRDKNPSDGLKLDFVGDAPGAYRPVSIPGVEQASMEVPIEGVSVKGKIYTYHTTDFSAGAVIGRTVVAVSSDECRTFRYLYDLSYKHFLNVSVVKTALRKVPDVPDPARSGLFIFGSGEWRKSPVMLAFQPAPRIEEKESLSYFAGFDSRGKPRWTRKESDSTPLFEGRGVGELSAAYNRFLGKWLLLYNGVEEQPGIFMRTADKPWGPWSEETTIYEGRRDGGFCRFLHSAWKSERCDILHEPGRENLRAVVYGPYILEDFAAGKDGESTVWFTLSTWNPYTVVLMEMRLRRTGSAGH